MTFSANLISHYNCRSKKEYSSIHTFLKLDKQVYENHAD